MNLHLDGTKSLMVLPGMQYYHEHGDNSASVKFQKAPEFSFGKSPKK